MAQSLAARCRKLGVHLSLALTTLERLDAEAAKLVPILFTYWSSHITKYFLLVAQASRLPREQARRLRYRERVTRLRHGQRTW